MNFEQLRATVAQSESERLELKRSTGQRSDAANTICAMLNGSGGVVLFGVTDAGEIVGQEVSAKTLEDVVHEIRRIEPPSFPDVTTTALDNGRAVVVVEVAGGGGPFTYDGRPYQRHGPTTAVMPRERYERLLLERMHAVHRWENQPAFGLTVDDLDHAEIRRTVDEAIRRQRLEDPGTLDPTDILLGLGLVREGELLNAAVVLFGRRERMLSSYINCILRMGRFGGVTKNIMLDNRQEVGNAFDLMIRAQRFMRDHLPIAGRIEPDRFERIDEPLYPTEALREALANAFCHRDYSIGGGAVSLAIYDDRLEISSTGVLPFGLSPVDLLRPHRSRPWNPLIAQAFYRRGMIEAWGRGTIKIAELMAEAGLPPPEFEIEAGEVVVRFLPSRYVPPTRTDHSLSPLQREILTVLASAGPLSFGEISVALASATLRRTLQDNLRFLRELGLVAVHGERRWARWSLLRPASNNWEDLTS
jgi:ATP-dependent DNA helicase RecG